MRRAYLDWARGVAVLIMIQAHTFDAWTRAADRSTAAFRWLTIVGGFAAPFFLWLAGLSLVLAAESRLNRTGDRRDASAAAIRRGLEIFILAFLFRAQALVVTPGSPLITLFRVDILNIMGPSLVVAAIVWTLVPNRRWMAAAFAAVAAALALLTPTIRAAGWVDALPVWLQWHIRPAGEYTNFTFFPWAGFVFAGAVIGVLLAGITGEGSERRLLTGIGIAGLVLLSLGWEAAKLPTIYRSSSFWTSSPTYFLIRAGVLMAALAVIYAIFRAAGRCGVGCRPLARFGRSSLFVYWIHVELVYGYATWVMRQRLQLWQTALAYVTFCALMYAAIVARDALLERWARRSSARSRSVLIS